MRCRAALLFLALAAGITGAIAHPGIGIVVDAKGNIFYTDLKQAWKIAPGGARTVAVPNVHTHELYLDAQDNLFGEHLWYEGDATGEWGHRVWKLTAGGGEGDAGPRAIVHKRAPDGTVSALAGGGTTSRRDGAGREARFTDIRWMASAPDGTLHAIDAGALRRITSEGVVTTLAANLDEGHWHLFTSGRHHLMGLCSDARGNVYVAHAAAGQVKRVAPDGSVTVVTRSRPPYSPTGVTVTRSGDLYVLEYGLNNARVRRLSADGTERIY